MQVDVIEAQFAVLNKSITNAQNVENIIKLHAEFLGNLMSRAFLMTINDVSYYFRLAIANLLSIMILFSGKYCRN